LKLPSTTYDWVDDDLSPLFPNNFPSLKGVTRRVTVKVEQVINGSIRWTQNGLPWTDMVPQTPYLVALYQNNEEALPSYDVAVANGLGIDPRVRAFPARIGEVLEIVIQNSGSTAAALDVHPFHSHGAHFYDIGSGPGTYNVTENEVFLQARKPIRRDTAMLYRYVMTAPPGGNAGWRAWRIRVTDPGVWMIHCHTLQHMIMGMYVAFTHPGSHYTDMPPHILFLCPSWGLLDDRPLTQSLLIGMQTAWVFGDAQDILKLPRPMVQGYLTYGGNGYGNSTHWPEVVHAMN
jgi:hypothetical protein